MVARKLRLGWAVMPPALLLLPAVIIMGIAAGSSGNVCQTDSDSSVSLTLKDSGLSSGSMTDKNSDVGKRISYMIERFKAEGLSGDNISAIIAVGWRESNLNPKAVNPSGAVKGIFQWGSGGINGNRYGSTQDTVESQMDLAIKELKGSHKVALIGLSQAKNISESALAWDTGFEGVGANDGQRKSTQVEKWAQDIKKTYGLDFEGHINVGNSSVKDIQTSAGESQSQDDNDLSSYCSDDGGSVDGTGSIKAKSLTFWDKNSVPDDVKQYLHGIHDKKLDWGFTTPDAYNQCAGFSQVYMNAIWSPNFTFRGNGNVTAEAVAKVTGVKVTRTPKAGAVFSSDRPNHTGVVLHVLANGDLIIANQNVVKSGQNAGTSQDYEITLVPKKDYGPNSSVIGYGNMTFAYPGDNPKYKLHW